MAAFRRGAVDFSNTTSYVTERQKRQLKEISDQAPKFLFRGLTKSSGGCWRDPTGRGLNNFDEILPHAFHPNAKTQLKTPRCVWEISNLGSMVTSHYLGSEFIESEFSSWSHDLGVSLHFATRKGSHESYISVIDRCLLPSYNMIFHTLDLLKIGIPGATVGGSHEYLLYGPVKGPGLICVKLSDLTSMGFDCTQLASTAFRCLNPPIRSTNPSQSKDQSAIDFARAFLPDCIDERVPLFYFLAATRRAVEEYLVCEANTSTQLREWCIAFTRAIETEVKKPLPPDFSIESHSGIPRISSQPIAERPLILLRAMAYFAHGRERQAYEDHILRDLTRLGMVRKLVKVDTANGSTCSVL